MLLLLLESLGEYSVVQVYRQTPVMHVKRVTCFGPLLSLDVFVFRQFWIVHCAGRAEW